MKANASILRQIKAYDKNLSVKWNYEFHYWEIWYRRPTGLKLITPVVLNIYGLGGCYDYAPLDCRILDWLYSSDTLKHSKKWKWIGKKRYMERLQSRNNKKKNEFLNIAKDNYNMINQELLNPYISEQSSFVRPEIESRRERISYRRSLKGLYDCH